MKESLKAVASISLFLVLNLTCYSQQHDVAGWEQYRWGMSNEDIGRTADPRLTKLTKSEKFLGMHVDYVVPQYQIKGEVFTVYFQIDDNTGELTQILIRLKEQKSKAPREEIFYGVELLLARQYGEPLDKIDERRTSTDKFKFMDLTRVWRFPTTTIELAYGWDNQIDDSLLTIRYFPTKTSSDRPRTRAWSGLAISGLLW